MAKISSSIHGAHLVAEFCGCNRSTLNDTAEIEAILVKSVAALETDVVSRFFYQFRPDGITGCVMLQEAHITIHTWPQAGYASVDLYSSVDGEPKMALDALRAGLGAGEVQSLVVERGRASKEMMRVDGHRRVKSYTIDCRGDLIPDTVVVKNSANRGFGLFATRQFSTDELVYCSSVTLTEWDAEYIVKTDLGDSLHDADSLGYELRPPLIDLWPLAMKHTIAEHYGLGEVSNLEILRCITDEGEQEMLITGFDGLINHSKNPNVVMQWSQATVAFDGNDRPIWTVPTRAVRPIGKGEELFADYSVSLFDFVAPADWLP